MKDVEGLAREIFETGKLIQDRVFRVRNAIIESMDKNKELKELTVNQVHLLLTVKRCQKVSVTELSALLQVSPPSVSVMVDRLVEKGILERQHSEEDRRRVEVSISDKAVARIAQVEKGLLDSFVDLVEKIGPKTAQEWHRVLKKIKPVLEQEITK